MDSSTLTLAILAASGGIFTFLLGIITLYKDSNLKKREQVAKTAKEDRELDLRVQEAAMSLLEPQTLRINNLEKSLATLSESAGKCQQVVRQLTLDIQDRDAEISRQKEEIFELRTELDKLTKQVNGKPKTKPIKKETE